MKRKPTEVSEEVKEKFKGLSKQESADFQLSEWVEGRSWHNPVRDECCPDFSCCSGGKIMEKDLRIKFSNAYKMGDNKTMMTILGMGLSTLALSKGLNVHITGESTTIN